MKTFKLGFAGFFSMLALGFTAQACSPAPTEHIAPIPTGGDCGCGGSDSGTPLSPWIVALPHEGFVAKVAAVSDGVVLSTAGPDDFAPMFFERHDALGGKLRWSTPVAPNGATIVYALVADSATGDTTALVAFGGTFTVDGRTFARGGIEGGYAVLRLDGASGKLRWRTTLNTSSAAVAAFSESVAISKGGDVALCGTAALAQTFGGQTVSDGFVLVLSSTDGAPKSSASFVKTPETFYPSYPAAVAVDGADQAWVTGRFSGTTTFGASPLTASGKNDGFVARLGKDLSVLSIAQVSTSGDDATTSIVADNSGQIYVRGVLGAAGSVAGASLAAGPWLASFDEIGQARWARPFSDFGASGTTTRLSGAPSSDVDVALADGAGVAVDANGKVVHAYAALAGVQTQDVAGTVRGRYVGGYVEGDTTVLGTAIKGPAPVVAFVQ